MQTICVGGIKQSGSVVTPDGCEYSLLHGASGGVHTPQPGGVQLAKLLWVSCSRVCVSAFQWRPRLLCSQPGCQGTIACNNNMRRFNCKLLAQRNLARPGTAASASCAYAYSSYTTYNLPPCLVRLLQKSPTAKLSARWDHCCAGNCLSGPADRCRQQLQTVESLTGSGVSITKHST
jgi:hypothetical protein